MRNKYATEYLMTFSSNTFTENSASKEAGRGLLRDVVYLGWPIAPSYASPNAGGGGELRGLSQWVQLYTGAQINFGDLTPYLTMAYAIVVAAS